MGNGSELVDRSAQALLGLTDQLEDPCVGRLLHLGTREAEREGQAEQALLRPVVEVALEPTALGLTRRDDPGSRGAEILDPSQDLRVKSFVVERETGSRRHFIDDGRIVEEARAMDERRDRSALASERRPRQSLRDLDRPPVGVDQLVSPVEGIREPECRVTQRPPKHLLESAGSRRSCDLDN